MVNLSNYKAVILAGNKKVLRDRYGRFLKGNSPYNKTEWHFQNLTPELAYIIGIYLTDGYVQERLRDIHKNGVFYKTWTFQLFSIDKELVNYSKKCLEKILNKPIKIYSIQKSGNRKLQYYLSVDNNDFGS